MSNLSRRRTLVKRDRDRRARYRIRKKISGTPERPRLAVFKSLKFIYAQVIDDLSGQTLAQASSRESAIASGAEGSAGSISAAKAVGKAVAERAKEKGIETVVFDRGGSIYHGKIRAIAEGAREAGLDYVYLGYWVPGSRKMDYKSRFKPLEIFRGGRWQELDAETEVRMSTHPLENDPIAEQVAAIYLPTTS